MTNQLCFFNLENRKCKIFSFLEKKLIKLLYKYSFHFLLVIYVIPPNTLSTNCLSSLKYAKSD
jgi:hypothetical protein